MISRLMDCFFSKVNDIEEYASTDPIPYMHETEATIIVSLLSTKDLVAECLSLSICSLIDDSFSIYVSLLGT